MSSTGDSLAERVQASYLQLSAVASDLNAVSDQLGKSIAEVDDSLKKLNLGVSVWVTIDGNEDAPYYWNEDLGYSKIDGKWGIALRTVKGNYAEDEERVEAWLFNDAPRPLRLSAISKLPELLKRLSEEAVETTKKIKSSLKEAQQVVVALKTAVLEPTSKEPAKRIIASGVSTPPVWGEKK
jgi:hypothetical protein